MAGIKTLRESGQAQKEIKNSIFIAYAIPVETEEEAKSFVSSIKERHHDANHNVSAYLINRDNMLAMKYDDDGEPAGSSGKPVFKILEMKELSNVAVVVTRYFGGVKLGFGGLARAYREAAIEAIENAGIIEVTEKSVVKIESDYSDMDTVSRFAEQYGTILKTDFSEVVSFTVEVDSDYKDSFQEKLINITKNRVTII
ncbi:YigZ family protein [Methanolobus sediminis]|uniref:YigZ family protein n=1 Tax=Methanolobus sediminis TaxID=3072978 RepID=A0AA51UIF7_9EURY|nr:YigZ family protein [Methanolobus sediminis]WMW24158.1 YigZ family protein [Methanolobus sediminis]